MPEVDSIRDVMSNPSIRAGSGVALCNWHFLHMQLTAIAYANQPNYTRHRGNMVLSELRAAARTSQEGWLISWTPDGYIISKGVTPEMRLEAERSGKKRLRHFKSLDAAARVMAEDIGVQQYTVRGRAPGQQEMYLGNT